VGAKQGKLAKAGREERAAMEVPMSPCQINQHPHMLPRGNLVAKVLEDLPVIRALGGR